VFYYFSDHLKTASVITDSASVIKAESDYYPWGGELQFVNKDSNQFKYTGKERDNETGLDYFGARYYSNGQDIIEARPSNDDRILEYVRCVKKSGNRTLRVIFEDYRSEDQPAKEILRGLRNLGCSYEGMQPRMISINVPPNVDLEEITGFLVHQSGLQWEYADPTYEEIHG